METNVQKPKVIHGEVSSVGPLQYKRDGTARRVLTIKVPDANATRYVGAYLVGEDATDCAFAPATYGHYLVGCHRFRPHRQRPYHP